jgi:prophage antirepressor-like protein
MNALQSFAFDNRSVRVVISNNQPWFCALDVCRVLGYANSRDAISKHCRAKGVAKRDVSSDVANRDATSSARESQHMTFIDEGNLYRLILRSRKPEAERFESWVCDEVLPSIRQTGGYQHAGLPLPGSEKERQVTAILLEAARRLELEGNIIERILPVLSDYGRPNARGHLKTGLRRAAFVASRQRSRDAAAVLTFSLQLELPFPASASHAIQSRANRTL